MVSLKARTVENTRARHRTGIDTSDRLRCPSLAYGWMVKAMFSKIVYSHTYGRRGVYYFLQVDVYDVHGINVAGPRAQCDGRRRVYYCTNCLVCFNVSIYIVYIFM